MTTILPGFHKSSPELNRKHRKRKPQKFNPPRKWQKRGYKTLRTEPYGFIAAPPGSGKSTMIAMLAHNKLSRDPNLKVIIIVPKLLIGFGFEDCRFQSLGHGNIFFNPRLKLHRLIHDGAIKDLEQFLQNGPSPSVNARAAIVSQQAFVQAYQQSPGLFCGVLVVVDEAHHSQATEEEGDLDANYLGTAVVDLVGSKCCSLPRPHSAQTAME